MQPQMGTHGLPPPALWGCATAVRGSLPKAFLDGKTYSWVGAGPGDAEQHQELHAGLAGAKSLSLVPCHALL